MEASAPAIRHAKLFVIGVIDDLEVLAELDFDLDRVSWIGNKHPLYGLHDVTHALLTELRAAAAEGVLTSVV